MRLHLVQGFFFPGHFASLRPEDEQPAFFGLALGPIVYFTRPKRGCDRPATLLLA